MLKVTQKVGWGWSCLLGSAPSRLWQAPHETEEFHLQEQPRTWPGCGHLSGSRALLPGSAWGLLVPGAAAGREGSREQGAGRRAGRPADVM